MDYLEGEVERINQEQFAGQLPVHNRSVLRSMLERENRQWGEQCERDYSPADEGMHWSDNA